MASRFILRDAAFVARNYGGPWLSMATYRMCQPSGHRCDGGASSREDAHRGGPAVGPTTVLRYNDLAYFTNSWVPVRGGWRSLIVSRLLRPILLSALGALALVVFLVGLFQILPPLSPPAPAPAPAARTERRPRQRSNAKGASAPSREVSDGPFGFDRIAYAGFSSTLLRQGRTLGVKIVVPRFGPPGTTMTESYIGSGSQLSLIYTDMLIVESPDPIVPFYQPSATTAAQISNGEPATWEWVPGEGGPAYRLLFREGSTYVRLQVFSPLPDTLTEAEDIAATFHPVGAA